MAEEGTSGQMPFHGPLTLKEIKQILSVKKPVELIQRRASISDSQPSRKIYTDFPTMDYFMKKQFFDDSYVSFASEYFTPNESLQHDQSITQSHYSFSTPNKINNIDEAEDNFIVKISKALNSPVHSTSSDEERPNVKSSVNLKSYSAISYIGKDIRESQYIDRETDTILILSDDENESIKKYSDMSASEEIESNQQDQNDSEIYVISDDDSSFEEPLLIKNEIQEESQNLLQVANLKNQTLDEVNLPNTDQNDLVIKLSCDLNSSNDSACRVNSPKIVNLATAELSTISNCDSSSDYEFNDTLEEMEMALKNGLGYIIQEKGNADSETALLASEAPVENIFQTDTSAVSVNERTKKTLIPVSCSKSHKKFSPFKTPAKQDFGFKVPTRLAAVRKTPDFKNIISPVAAYIKSSPQVPQIQHIVPKPLSAILFPKFPGNRVITTECDDLPRRMYKPAKQNCVSKEIEQKLPSNIRKYIPDKPEVIKHQGRIQSQTSDPASVEQKLLCENLTVNFDDSSILDSSSVPLVDVSVLTSKKTYMK